MQLTLSNKQGYNDLEQQELADNGGAFAGGFRMID